MGNSISHRPSDATGKVILLDGTVHEYDKPLTVAELMLEYPQQVVVDYSQSVASSKRPSPLPADQKLEMDKVYLMHPMMKRSALSSEEARLLLLRANSVLKSRSLSSSSSGFLPLFARICPGEGRQLVLHRKENSVLERTDQDATKPEFFTNILEGRPEYLSRQLSGKVWKPSLDTIKEKRVKKKVSHWLF